MKKQYDPLKDFLVSAYFGDYENRDLRSFCAERAYLDLARRVPYRISTSELSKKNADNTLFLQQKDQFKNSVVEVFEKGIKYEVSPYLLIRDVLKVGEEYGDLFKGDRFTFGLAQKWVNMTLKYYWLLGGDIDPDKLHAPIDSYIIHALTVDSKTNPYGIKLEIEGLHKDLKWSTKQLDYALYKKIQEGIVQEIMVGNFATIIDWENAAWIEQNKIEQSRKAK